MQDSDESRRSCLQLQLPAPRIRLKGAEHIEGAGVLAPRRIRMKKTVAETCVEPRLYVYGKRKYRFLPETSSVFETDPCAFAERALFAIAAAELDGD